MYAYFVDSIDHLTNCDIISTDNNADTFLRYLRGPIFPGAPRGPGFPSFPLAPSRPSVPSGPGRPWGPWGPLAPGDHNEMSNGQLFQKILNN